MEVDLDLARDLLLSAANQGVSDAAYELGQIYRDGIGLDSNELEAVEWFRIGARAGHPGSQKIMGSLYEQGIVVEEDMARAYFWYSLASVNGASKALTGRSRVMSQLSLSLIHI